MTLSVQNGSFSYNPKAGKNILNDISLTVEKGGILAILGPNGSGKTTLLRCMTGFLPWTSGESYLDGRPLSSIPASLLWRRLAYVPQARGTASGVTVENMVLLGRSSRIGMFRQPGREDYAAAAAVLDRLGLSALRNRRCDEISGGELQMTLIARALAAEPECVILDEPESNLDFKNQLLVLQTLQSLRDDGISCIFNTHYPDHALRWADNALMLDGKGGYLFGPTAEVVTQPSLTAAFGVESVIGELETKHNVYRSVAAISILNGDNLPPAAAPNSAGELAVVSILIGAGGDTERVNEILHQYREHIAGRFGMPRPDRNAHIITIVMDAPESAVAGLCQRLGAIRGISAKATYSR